MIKNILLTSTLLSIACTTTMTHAKEYYKWIDAKGSTHYTTTPPPKNAKKKGKIETYGTTASNAVQNNTATNTQTPTTPANNATTNTTSPAQTPTAENQSISQ